MILLSPRTARTNSDSLPAKTNFRKAFSYIVKLTITVSLIIYVLKDIDVRYLVEIASSSNPVLISFTLFMLFLERFFAAFRWFLLIRQIDRSIKYAQVLRITFLANFLGAFLPGSVGIEALRIYGIARLKADIHLALSSIFAERIFGLTSLFTVIGLGLLFSPLPIPDLLVKVLISFVAFLALAIALLYHRGARRCIRRVMTVPMLHRFIPQLQGLASKLDIYIAAPGAIAVNFILGCLNQILRALSFLVGALALGISVDPLALLVIAPITVFIALLPISLGGFGPREATFVSLMALVGVPAEKALALVLLREACNLAATLPGAKIYLSLGFANKSKKMNMVENS